MYNNFSYSLTYPHVMHNNRRQFSSNNVIFRALIFVRQVFQPSGQHLELSAGVRGEQRGDPADAGRHNVNDNAANQMHRKHNFVSRTLLRIEKDIVIALHQRPDRHISDYDFAADYWLNQTVSKAAGEQEQRTADEDEAPGSGLVQHDSAIVRVPYVSPVLLQVPHALLDTILP